MKTEKEKMLAGELYNGTDPQLSKERTDTRLLIKQLNNSDADDPATRLRLLKALLPDTGTNLWIEPPFHCDYGTNIKAGDQVYFNFNCVVLDVMQVTIGSRTLFGPAVQIYTATHPVDAALRASGLEYAKPVQIGSDVWIGGGSVICPGVTIGDRTVIGAGSVVTKDIPADVVAAGTPCRVIRPVTAADAQQFSV